MIENKRNVIKELKIALNSPYLLDFSLESFYGQFRCIDGCTNCCSYTYFLPNEITPLPRYILHQLNEIKDGRFEVSRNNKRCIFFNESTQFHCTIHKNRPLRCRIYPLFPLIVENRIVITFEPALKMLNQDGDRNSCLGIGVKGDSLQSMIDDCIIFIKSLKSVPALLSTIVLTNMAFKTIRQDNWFIETEICSNNLLDNKLNTC
ncbi:MAG: YkgJ family cysteine cluster protein [Candidatus Heimdallarchaeota archaeon]|nr:YkgJ family cysteine cluster protein [Candidatus Heimdallarchaeota archaeon]